MNNLPEWYLAWIDRVSSIVSFKFPFEWNSRMRYQNWLNNLWITEEDYWLTATEWWTEIHKALEDYVLGNKIPNKILNKHKDEIEWAIRYIDWLIAEYPEVDWRTEVYLRDEHNRYQGTVDLVRVNEKTKEVWIYDYKSYEVAKRKYWIKTKELLKNWSLPKPTDKLTKVSLQMSLYAKVFEQLWYKVRWIYLVWVHKEWTFEYKADLWTNNELEKLLIEYKFKWNNNMTIKYPLKIHLQTAPITYSNISVELDLSDIPEWEREFAVNEAVEIQKKLHLNYLPKDRWEELKSKSL